jgi:hypothetical protein
MPGFFMQKSNLNEIRVMAGTQQAPGVHPGYDAVGG